MCEREGRGCYRFGDAYDLSLTLRCCRDMNWILTRCNAVTGYVPFIGFDDEIRFTA